MEDHTVNFLVLVFLVFDSSDIDHSSIREDEAIFCEVFVACEEDSVEHGFVEEEVAHPFGDDDVELVEWKRHFF